MRSAEKCDSTTTDSDLAPDGRRASQRVAAGTRYVVGDTQRSSSEFDEQWAPSPRAARLFGTRTPATHRPGPRSDGALDRREARASRLTLPSDTALKLKPSNDGRWEGCFQAVQRC